MATASALLAALACDHTAPFAGGSGYGVGPFSPGSPVRLTFNSGVDRGPVWLPDGSGFLYTQEQMDRQDRDQCLAVMPQAGGTVTRTICATSDPLGDSLNALESPSVSADGRMAYVRSSMYAFAGRHTPDYGALVLATYQAPLQTTVLEPLSYFGPSSQSVDLVRDIVWTGPASMIYVAERVTYGCANTGCTVLDTGESGIEIQSLDYSTSPPTLSVVSNTSSATSLAAGKADTVYFTVAGSGQVHRRALSTGADTVVFDFGSPVTDLSAAGSRFAGVQGSAMRVVDLVTALDNTFMKTDTNFHRPALSPDGHRVVVGLAPVDTLTGLESAPPDLWMWKLP
ncbi:MAG TPA: hypothetical protein VN674_06680 [Gemmatimonadales bacterium]|nr:hypothetical protein [Gemmatimonadales bacterium]